MRPTASDTGPATSSATASAAVVSDIASVARVGETSYASTSSGSSAWTS